MNQVSLFAGVGAFELAARHHKIKTVFSCEIDKHAAKVLGHHFPETEVFNDDVRKVRGSELTARYGAIDILTAGFPCQAFSIAGKREGFNDATRGTLFFEVARLADEIRPDYVILENVKGLLNHEWGRTFGVIISRLGELGYDVEWQLLNSKYFGVPQNRERVFIVGHFRGRCTREIFPIKSGCGEAKEGETARCIDANYSKGIDNHGARTAVQVGEIAGFDGGGVRRLTPVECERLQGFPDGWTKVEGMSDTQRYKQMGNSITVNVLDKIYKKIRGK